MSESQDLKDFKDRLWKETMKAKRELGWCAEAEELLTGRLDIKPPELEDIFPHGTILAYEGTTYIAHKSYSGQWEYGGSGEANKSYGDYQGFVRWVREMGSRPRVLRYGSNFGHVNSGRYYEHSLNTLVEEQ